MTVREFVIKESLRRGRRIKVGLIGLGKTNRAVYERIFDICEITVRSDRQERLPYPATKKFGDGYLDGIYEDVLFLSPSVRRDLPQLRAASANGTLITSECEVFFRSSGTDGRKIFGVTGSDGKTTVTAMASEMLSAAAVGNIGIPFSEREGEDAYVCELSSFNLYGFKPHTVASVITSLSPNHLNWHTDLSEYYSAKLGLLEGAGRAVMHAGGDCLPFLGKADTLFSCEMTGNELFALGARHAVHIDGGFICYDGAPIIAVSELMLKERHNILNFMAALGLCHGFATAERIREVGMGFCPPHHRCERVHVSKSGTVFINSSIDTTPTRTATTLSGLDRSVFLILGGRGKGLSPLPILLPVARYATAVLAYGEFGREICEFLKGDGRTSTIPVIFRERLSDGLYELKSAVADGDTVLLSPAATAYGEFENFEKRGAFFTEFVKKHFP